MLKCLPPWMCLNTTRAAEHRTWAWPLVKGGQNHFPILQENIHINAGLALKCLDTMATLVFQMNGKAFDARRKNQYFR